MIWRWDQGRSQYFHFDSIQKIAPVLVSYNGADMQMVDSAFRDDLMKKSELPFAPQHYTVKRNYKRVFECSLLATYIGNRLIVTDIARAIASGNKSLSTVDAYLFEVERRFRYPFPAFSNYSDVKATCYPFIAIIKLLFAKALRNGNANASISLEEVGSCLIANEVTGTEDLDFYWDLSASEFSFDSYSSNDQKRQVREMMSFIGQHSYLTYNNSCLYLSGITLEEIEDGFDKIMPLEIEVLSHNPVDDFLRLTAYADAITKTHTEAQESQDDLEAFTVEEGKLVFTSHFSRERDAVLRKAYLKDNPDPVCDVCGKNMHILYPWTENMLEIHHLRPLASFDDQHSTSVNDVVGLCPSCHRAIHIYYRNYLKQKGLSDFKSNEEAESVYNQAKMEVDC